MLDSSGDDLAINNLGQELLRNRTLNKVVVAIFCRLGCQDIDRRTLGRQDLNIQAFLRQVDHARIDLVQTDGRGTTQDLNLDRLGVDEIQRRNQRIHAESCLCARIHCNRRDLALDLNRRVFASVNVHRLIELNLIQNHFVVVLKVFL